MHCTINATIFNTLTKRFHRDEKISLLMLSSSVVCLSFTSSKNKKGIIKILVYISVIDINQIDVLLRLGAICVGGSHVLIGLLEISHKNGIFSLFTRKYNFGVVPGWGICNYIFEPHRGAFAAFPKQNDKCPGEGGID